MAQLHVRDWARLGKDDYPATLKEIETEIAWCEYRLSLPATPQEAKGGDHLRTSDRDDINVTLSEMKWIKLERQYGASSLPVNLVATHANYPVDCVTSGMLFSQWRVVVNYPFVWTEGHPSSEPNVQIDVSRVLLPDRTELHGWWREIAATDLTEDDLHRLELDRQSLQSDRVQGQWDEDTLTRLECIESILSAAGRRKGENSCEIVSARDSASLRARLK